MFPGIRSHSKKVTVQLLSFKKSGFNCACLIEHYFLNVGAARIVRFKSKLLPVFVIVSVVNIYQLHTGKRRVALYELRLSINKIKI